MSVCQQPNTDFAIFLSARAKMNVKAPPLVREQKLRQARNSSNCQKENGQIASRKKYKALYFIGASSPAKLSFHLRFLGMMFRSSRKSAKAFPFYPMPCGKDERKPFCTAILIIRLLNK